MEKRIVQIGVHEKSSRADDSGDLFDKKRWKAYQFPSITFLLEITSNPRNKIFEHIWLEIDLYVQKHKRDRIV